jgi:hypothetical protein
MGQIQNINQTSQFNTDLSQSGLLRLPTDLLQEISYYLPCCNLNSVSKRLINIYDENFYQTKLKRDYPELTLKIKTTWKDLYIKSLREGKLSCGTGITRTQLKIPGIKVVYNGSNYGSYISGNTFHKAPNYPSILILRFNGNLYKYHEDSDETILIDTDVVDIDTNIYIKDNKCIHLYETTPTSTERKWTPTEYELDQGNFESVHFYGHISFAVTCKNIIYYFEHNSRTNNTLRILNYQEHVPFGAPSGSIEVASKVKNLQMIENYLFILLENGNLNVGFPGTKFHLGIIKDVQDMKGNVIKIKNEYHIIYINPWKYHHSGNIFKDITDNLISYPLNENNNIKNCIIDCYSTRYLTKKGIYCVQILCDTPELMTEGEFKHICGGSFGMFEIC